MVDSFRSSARGDRDQGPACTKCNHLKGMHYDDFKPGAQPGSGRCHDTIQQVRAGSYPCTCSSYSEPITRPRFTRTQADTEIGSGYSTGTSNLQGHHMAEMGGRRSGDPRNETPEWVMVGIRMPDGSVEVYASTKLSFISLRQEAETDFERINEDLIRKGVVSGKPWDLRGRMVGYLQTAAPNYADALKMLFNRGWQPGTDDEPAPQPQESSTADLQRQAALEDLAAAQPVVLGYAEPDEIVDDEIYDAEIVEDDD